jgi:S1-C subfamily serine protease
MAGLAGKKSGRLAFALCGEFLMAQDHHPETYTRSGPSAGGSVNGWLVAILLILVAALYLQFNGLWPQPLLDPNAAPREVTARGNLAEDEQATINLFKAVNKSVVHITTSAIGRDFRMNPTEVPAGSGSGFVWDNKGYIVTNYHVIRGARRADGKINVVLYNSRTLPAEVVGVNPGSDLAVLKVKAAVGELNPIPIGRSSELQVGQKVFAIGSPFSLDQSLSTGIVSGLGREIRSAGGEMLKDVIQVNAAINPGNSGGPLLDSAGRLIGVTTAILSETGQFSGLGFAIPVDTVNAVVPQLIQSGTTEPPALGLTLFRDDQAAILRERGYLKQDGVLVANVWQNGGAEAAGIRPTRQTWEGIVLGDLITHIDGKPTPNTKTVAQLISQKKVGDVVHVTIDRDGKPLEADVTLRPQPLESDQ